MAAFSFTGLILIQFLYSEAGRLKSNVDQSQADEPEMCSTLQGWMELPCHNGWRYGCYDEPGISQRLICWRTNWKTSTEWGWFQKRSGPNGKGENTEVYCASNDDCLGVWNDLDAEIPGDMPCYLSEWWQYPCYKGRRWACSRSVGETRPKYCWYENPKVWGSWDYVHEDTETNKCAEDDDCKEDAWAKIDQIQEEPEP